MKNILNKIRKNKKTFLIIVLFCAILALGFGVKTAWAADTFFGGVGQAIAIILGWIVYAFAFVIGQILTLVIKILVDIASVNNIIDVEAVRQGWTIVRDLCNMFFILILLIIAFATILRIESYSAKRLLPKLLIMAVLINFSKTIFGLVIDFAQVIMLTFVNGFGQYGAANLVNLFKIKDYLSISNVTNSQIGTMETMGAIMAGFFAIVITFIVVVVLLAVLVMRLIMLWVYTILSPFVFMGMAFPPMQKYTGRIWEDFVKNVVVGPVLAFFIWLALTAATNSVAALSSITPSQVSIAGVQTGQFCAGASTLFCSGAFTTYIITIALLIGGLMVTQQIGGIAGSIAGKGMQWAKRAPMLAGKGMVGASSWGARKFAASKHGFELRPSKVIAGFKETLAEKKRKEDIRIEEKSASMLKEGKVIRGGLGASRDFSEAAAHGFLWNRAWKRSDDPKKMGVMQSTWKVAGVRKNIEKLEKEKNNKKTTDARRAEIDKEIPKLREQMGEYATPQTFYSQQKSMAAYQEAAKKSGMKDNEEEIVETFDKAVTNGDNELAVGMILHSAEVYHGNEMIQMHKALEDVYGDDGKTVVIKKGDSFDQSNAGVRGFFNQYVKGKMGLSEQETYSIQSQFASRAKAVNHMNLSESVGKKNGLFFQRGDAEQQARAHTESMKMDVETLLRKLNRIGWGNEVQYEDKDDLDKNGKPKTKRRFVANDLTVKDFVKTAPTLDLEVNDRKRFNPNAAENFFVNYMFRQIDPNKFEESIVERMDKLGTSYTAKSGDTVTHKQLAMETVAFGGDKYIANLTMERVDAKTSNALPEEINKIQEKINKAKDILNRLQAELKGPDMIKRATAKKEGGETK